MIKIYMSNFLSILFFFHAVFFSKFVFSDDLLNKVIKSDKRTAEYVMRDKFRNPKETLLFFGINQNMKVIELQPSGGNSPGGWYTEILAPYLQEDGLLIAAHFNPEESEWRAKMRRGFEEKIKYNEDFSKIKMSVLAMPPGKLTEDNSVDMVVTFRNLHNWLKSGYLKNVFQVSFNALKPGGIFGVVEHRAPDNYDVKQMKASGYVTESLAINLAKDVGFILVDKSEINANKKDTKNHPKGVWTLPPTLKLKDKNKDKYLMIGESDRMTLKFIKP
ncbi:methyltransferase [Alphaproteobacteria bacterium]|nr:methyltransferase [Alphaproteobacteria bacterium]